MLGPDWHPYKALWYGAQIGSGTFTSIMVIPGNQPSYNQCLSYSRKSHAVNSLRKALNFQRQRNGV